MKLDAQKALFCAALIKSAGMDVAEAAGMVGATVKQARLWLKDPVVSKELDRLLRLRAKRLLIDADYVLLGLIENAEIARGMGMIRESTEALCLVGRHLGMSLDNQPIGGGSVGTQIIFSGVGRKAVGGNRVHEFERPIGAPRELPVGVDDVERVSESERSPI